MYRSDGLAKYHPWQELEGAALDVAMAQHLLVAADRFQLPRLRRICERRLCETVEVGTGIFVSIHALINLRRAKGR